MWHAHYILMNHLRSVPWEQGTIVYYSLVKEVSHKSNRLKFKIHSQASCKCSKQTVQWRNFEMCCHLLSLQVMMVCCSLSKPVTRNPGSFMTHLSFHHSPLISFSPYGSSHPPTVFSASNNSLRTFFSSSLHLSCWYMHSARFLLFNFFAFTFSFPGCMRAASPWCTLGVRSCRTFCSDLAW